MRGRASIVTALLLLCSAPWVHAQGAEADDGFFELAVPGGWRSLSAFGIARDEQGLALPLLVRRLYGTGGVMGGPGESLQSLLAGADQGLPQEAASIPVPLSADTWRSALELKSDRSDLFHAIGADRSAALVASGLAAADVSVRTWMNGERTLLRWVRRAAPGAMAVVGPSLSIEHGRFVLPGGRDLAPAWQSLVGQPPSSLEPFLRALLTRDAGRLAWFFDTMALLDAERLAVVVPPGTPPAREEALAAMYAAFRDVDSNWRLEGHPFLRGVADSAAVLATVAVADGQLAPPNAAWMWRTLFGRRDIDRRDADRIERQPAAPVGIAWLTREIVRANPRERAERFEMFRLAQRVFGAASGEDVGNVLVALSSYYRFKSLLLTLERMEVRTPAVWATAVEAARTVDGSGDRGHAIATFQGTLAIIERAQRAGTLDGPVVERLVSGLASAVRDARDVPRAIGEFIIASLVPALPRLRRPDRWTVQTAYESIVLQAMAGPEEPQPLKVAWEGLTYELDLAGGELARMHAVRVQLPSPGLDAALGGQRPADLAAALTAIVYSAALGDPEGAVTLSPDIAARHDLGADSSSWMRRDLQPWLPPREQMGDGGPWRVSGSLFGLELALARLALRRIQDQEMPPAPSINLNDQITLARTVTALQPQRLTDSDRGAIVAAIDRGRARVTSAGTNVTALLALADEARLSAHVRQVLPWMIRQTPGAVNSLFPPSRLLWLGKPAVPQDRLDLWGVFGDSIDARLNTVLSRPLPWENVGGRADLGQVATAVPDLTLRLAEETSRLRLPARLVPALLAYAVQDYWHDVDARFADDWPAMVRAAAALPARRVEDYVAALAGRVLR